MIEVLTVQDIITQYKVSIYFIKQHKVEMGLRGKPLRGERSLIDDFFRKYFRAVLEQRYAEEAEARARAEEICRTVETFRSRQARTGKIKGKLRSRDGAVA